MKTVIDIVGAACREMSRFRRKLKVVIDTKCAKGVFISACPIQKEKEWRDWKPIGTGFSGL
jgi:hypothetical protein